MTTEVHGNKTAIYNIGNSITKHIDNQNIKSIQN